MYAINLKSFAKHLWGKIQTPYRKYKLLKNLNSEKTLIRNYYPRIVDIGVWIDPHFRKAFTEEQGLT